MTITILNFMAEKVIDFFRFMGYRKQDLKEDERKAIQAFLTALNETEIHLGDAPPFRNDGFLKPNGHLSRSWIVAAELVKPIDQELAERCLSKASFWADPSHWSQADIKRGRILISQMQMSARNLLDSEG